MPRFYKATSPSRNWFNNRYQQRNLPPQHPYYLRRGSNTPSTLATITTPPILPPNRSRSLDGLLDNEPSIIKKIAIEENAQITNPSKAAALTKSCDDLENDDDKEETDRPIQEHNNIDIDSDKVSLHSSSSESKRKRNFMDRCVNKVRSLIKK